LTTVPNAGFTTTTPIAANGTIRVIVTATVTATAPNAPLTVRLGNTVPPGPQNAQNILDSADGAANLNDVRTVDDDPGATGSNPGLPVNGEREAANTQEVLLGTAVTPRALAKVLKTRTQYDPNTAAFNDDTITYRLDLEVENISPSASFTPAALEGTLPQEKVTGATAPTGGKFILVSDAIPANTTLTPADNFTPTVPNNDWTVVYSNTTLGTPATSADWNTTRPATVTRIGWVYTGANSNTASIASGTTTTGTNGFQFRVTSNLTAAGTISNIAQVFGETVGDTNNEVVYDESGDQNPNNFNDDGTPRDPDGLGGPINDGQANPSTQGLDNNNNNTGQGPGGEVNQTPIGVTPTGGILNGPLNQPAATGPDGTQQTDFVNRTVIPPNIPGAFDPAAITFNNTANNPGTGRLDNVVIKPIPPSQADFVADGIAANQTDLNTGYGINGDALTNPNAALPDGTTVTITDPTLGRTAIYTWNGTAFNLTSAAGTEIRFSNFAAGGSRNYTVTVNLPDGTASTRAFPVAIVAFVDQDNDNEFDRLQGSPNAEPIFNLKIDRAYTGYIDLLKESRILQGTGPAVQSGQGSFSIAPKTPAPGNIIEYRITYTNISTTASAAINGSVLLNANALKIVENGTAAPNNWANFTTHEAGTVAEPGTTVNYFSGTAGTTPLGDADPTSGQSVTSYENTVGTLTGGDTGAFTFRRKVNQAVTP
jgi:hypothetical protein